MYDANKHQAGYRIVLKSDENYHMLPEMRRKLHESQLYNKNTLTEVEKLCPSASFYEFTDRLSSG